MLRRCWDGLRRQIKIVESRPELTTKGLPQFCVLHFDFLSASSAFSAVRIQATFSLWRGCKSAYFL